MLFLKEKEELNKESEAMINTLIMQHSQGVGTGLPSDKSELKDMQLDLLSKTVEFDKRKLDLLAREKIIDEKNKNMEEKEKKINQLQRENVLLNEKLTAGYENMVKSSQNPAKVGDEVNRPENKEVDTKKMADLEKENRNLKQRVQDMENLKRELHRKSTEHDELCIVKQSLEEEIEGYVNEKEKLIEKLEDDTSYEELKAALRSAHHHNFKLSIIVFEL